MRKLLSALLLCNCISILSQTTFDAIEADVRNWCNEHKATFVLNSKAPKTIEFPTQHYIIEGVISKGILCEGTIAKFYETSSLAPDLLLEGKVTYNANRLIIDGIKYESTPEGRNKIYGSFYVYNMDDYSMNYKAKKAGDLRTKCQNAAYLEGHYLQCPVIVSLVDGSSAVHVDGKTGGRGYAFLSAIIPGITLNDDDSFDAYQILLQAKDDVTMCWENGMMFKGRVKPTPKEDGTIVFYTLDGQKTGMTTGPKRITVSHENGNLIYTQEDNDDNRLLSKEILFVRDDGTLSEMDYWDIGKIYESCYLAKWSYRNGNSFEGSIKTVITPNENTNTSNISSTATKGVFKYPNGDRFEGDVSSKSVGPFFIDGTTFFADGRKVKGNWLEKYEMTNSQWDRVYECHNPSDAAVLAEKLMKEYEEQKKEEYYNLLVDRVKALGETPYQKSLISWRDKCLKRLEKECWVSGQTILGSIMIEGLVGGVINQTTLGASMASAFMEAALNRPTVCKSIVSEMDVELKEIVKLALPIEIELEKLQSEKMKTK